MADQDLPLPVLVQNYCKKHQIQWNHEGFDQYEFIAPPGNVFPNESKYRIILLEDTSGAREVVDCLSLYEEPEQRG